jgi:hypothetical protein
LRAARPMLAGRPHEAAGNGSPRWMAAGPRSRGRTEPGLQAGSPFTTPLTCGCAVMIASWHTLGAHQNWRTSRRARRGPHQIIGRDHTPAGLRLERGQHLVLQLLNDHQSPARRRTRCSRGGAARRAGLMPGRAGREGPMLARRGPLALGSEGRGGNRCNCSMRAFGVRGMFPGRPGPSTWRSW